MACPDFICIGAIKSGTTWLHYNLQQHPEVWLPPIKELRYFNEPEYNLPGRLFGKDKKRYEYWRMQMKIFLHRKRYWLQPDYVKWHLNYFLVPRSSQWYQSLFASGKGQVAGDITPLYAPIAESQIAAIKKDFPDLKIIYILRNPIDRTWSHILLRCVSLVGWKPENLTEAFVRSVVIDRDLKDPWLFANGYYSENLNRWEKYFPAEQIFVGFYDDLKKNPRQFFEAVCQFLQIKENLTSQTKMLETRYNQKPIHLAIPLDIEKRFSGIFWEELQRLEKRFGGATSGWLHRAKRVLEKA